MQTENLKTIAAAIRNATLEEIQHIADSIGADATAVADWAKNHERPDVVDAEPVMSVTGQVIETPHLGDVVAETEPKAD